MTQFVAATGLKNPHLQTLFPRFIRKKALFEPVWQTLDTPDGDFLDLAWSEDPHHANAQNKPLFVLFHGLEGCFYSPYANGPDARVCPRRLAVGDDAFSRLQR